MEIFSALLAFVQRITGEFPHKGQWYGDLMFSLIFVWQTVERTIVTPVIQDAIAPIDGHCNDLDKPYMELNYMYVYAWRLPNPQGPTTPISFT